MEVSRKFLWAAVVAQRLSTRLRSKTLEVVGSNPARWWAFSSLLSPFRRVPLIHVPHRGVTLNFPLKHVKTCSWIMYGTWYQELIYST